MDSDSIMSRRYEITIYWGDDDRCYVAKVPELPGCMADGPSYQVAAANAERAIHDWIETAKDLGREIPEPRERVSYA